MRSLLWRLILLSPLFLLLVLFALSNTAPARIGLWPTDLVVEAPLSLMILGAMGLAFLLGALSTWVVGIGARMRARRLGQEAARLRAELEAAQARLARASQAPAGTVLAPSASREVARA
jgi:putative membrane protein